MKRWFWNSAPPRSDDAIADIVAAGVERGEIKPGLATYYAHALQDERDGKCIIMRDPGIKPRPPKKPSWSI